MVEGVDYIEFTDYIVDLNNNVQVDKQLFDKLIVYKDEMIAFTEFRGGIDYYQKIINNKKKRHQ